MQLGSVQLVSGFGCVSGWHSVLTNHVLSHTVCPALGHMPVPCQFLSGVSHGPEMPFRWEGGRVHELIHGPNKIKVPLVKGKIKPVSLFQLNSWLEAGWISVGAGWKGEEKEKPDEKPPVLDIGRRTL